MITLTNEQISQVAMLAAKLEEREVREAELEERLKGVRAEIQRLACVAIPEVFAELGVASLTLDSGASIEVKPFYAASISEADRPSAHAWLEENGHGALVKTKTVTSVHSSTLKAWVREQAEQGLVDSIPEYFHVYAGQKAKVTR